MHIPKKKIGTVLLNILKNLKSGGVGFISMKKGKGEMEKEDKYGKRFFAYYSKEEFENILLDAGFKVVESFEKSKDKITTWLCYFVRK